MTRTLALLFALSGGLSFSDELSASDTWGWTLSELSLLEAVYLHCSCRERIERSGPHIPTRHRN